MDILTRGLQLYLLSLGVVSMVTAVWGMNRFVLGYTTGGTGWDVLIGIAVVCLMVVLVVRYYRWTTDQPPLSEEYPW